MQSDREAVQGACCRRHRTGPPHRALRYAKQRAILLFFLSTNPVSLLLSYVRSIGLDTGVMFNCHHTTPPLPRTATAVLASGTTSSKTPQQHSLTTAC